MSARYDTAACELMDVSASWVGRPLTDREQVFALFHSVTGDATESRWYVYGIAHDALPVDFDKLPEAVRMAYLLII